MECLKKTKILFLQCVKSNNTKTKMYLNSSEGVGGGRVENHVRMKTNVILLH